MKSNANISSEIGKKYYFSHNPLTKESLTRLETVLYFDGETYLTKDEHGVKRMRELNDDLIITPSLDLPKIEAEQIEVGKKYFIRDVSIRKWIMPLYIGKKNLFGVDAEGNESLYEIDNDWFDWEQSPYSYRGDKNNLSVKADNENRVKSKDELSEINIPKELEEFALDYNSLIEDKNKPCPPALDLTSKEGNYTIRQRKEGHNGYNKPYRVSNKTGFFHITYEHSVKAHSDFRYFVIISLYLIHKLMKEQERSYPDCIIEADSIALKHCMSKGFDTNEILNGIRDTSFNFNRDIRFIIKRFRNIHLEIKKQSQ